MNSDDPFADIPPKASQKTHARPYFEVDEDPDGAASEETGRSKHRSKSSHWIIWLTPLFLLIGIVGVYVWGQASFSNPGIIHLTATEGALVEIFDKNGKVAYSTQGTGVLEVIEGFVGGQYSLSASKEGYEPLDRKSFAVQPDTIHTETIDLIPIPPGLMITSIPSAASVYDGTTYVGTTPLRYNPTDEKTLNIRLAKAGYQSISRDVQWVPESRQQWNAQLQESTGRKLFLQLIAAPNITKPDFFDVSLNGKEVEYFIHGVSENLTHTKLDFWIENLNAEDYLLGLQAENWSPIQQEVNPSRTSEAQPVILSRQNPELSLQLTGIKNISGIQDLKILLNGDPTTFKVRDRGINGEINLIIPEVHIGTRDIQIQTEKWKTIDYRITSEEQLSERPSFQLEKKPRYADLGNDLRESLSLAELMVYVDAGNPIAENQLGWRYFTGRDVPKDELEAAKWFQKAADKDLVQGQTNLAYMYENGLGVKRNHGEAAKWYLRAAHQGDPMAQLAIAKMYYNGLGVSLNLTESVKWFEKSANQGEPSAQINLGFMYENGYGVTRNLARAKFWYQKAADQGDSNGKEALVRFRTLY
jgi:hypothetical protein